MTNKKVEGIGYKNYDKLTDDIFHVGGNLILRMNVVLSKTDKHGNRYFYHNEFMYKSNKYLDSNELITLRRSFDYFLTLENIKKIKGREKESILIRLQDIMNLRMHIEKATKWFTDKEFEDMYAYDNNNRMVLLGTPTPISIKGLAAGKTIEIEPTVIDYDNNSTIGVRLYLNGPENYSDITVDKLMGLHYTFSCINMYQSAQLLLNYNGRPDMGECVVRFDDDVHVVEIEEPVGKTEGSGNRKIPRANKSFFDSVDDI